MLVEDSGGTIDIIEGGEKHYVSYDVSVYLASLYGYTNDPPADLPDVQFNAIPIGLQYFPTGMIVQDGNAREPSALSRTGRSAISAQKSTKPSATRWCLTFLTPNTLPFPQVCSSSRKA